MIQTYTIVAIHAVYVCGPPCAYTFAVYAVYAHPWPTHGTTRVHNESSTATTPPSCLLADTRGPVLKRLGVHSHTPSWDDPLVDLLAYTWIHCPPTSTVCGCGTHAMRTNTCVPTRTHNEVVAQSHTRGPTSCVWTRGPRATCGATAHATASVLSPHCGLPLVYAPIASRTALDEYWHTRTKHLAVDDHEGQHHCNVLILAGNTSTPALRVSG